MPNDLVQDRPDIRLESAIEELDKGGGGVDINTVIDFRDTMMESHV